VKEYFLNYTFISNRDLLFNTLLLCFIFEAVMSLTPEKGVVGNLVSPATDVSIFDIDFDGVDSSPHVSRTADYTYLGGSPQKPPEMVSSMSKTTDLFAGMEFGGGTSYFDKQIETRYRIMDHQQILSVLQRQKEMNRSSL
jgi:hypothetical protein